MNISTGVRTKAGVIFALQRLALWWSVCQRLSGYFFASFEFVDLLKSINRSTSVSRLHLTLDTNIDKSFIDIDQYLRKILLK